MLAAEICARIEEGESMASICRDPKMPAVNTVNDWKGEIAHFATALACARKASASALADVGLDLLDSLEHEPDLSMTTIRLAEMRAKYRKDLAKDYDRDTFGDKRQITADIQVEHTVGGIIEAIMGKSKPLVCLDAEEVETVLIERFEP
jgi:hypothetical protein